VFGGTHIAYCRCSGPQGTGPADSTLRKGRRITHMTLTRSLRPLAAAALAAGLVLPAAASASGYSGGPGRHDGVGHDDGVRHASSHSGHQRHTVDGVLETMSGTTLTVQTASGTTVTVSVPATTKFERRYNGRSSLDELTEGD